MRAECIRAENGTFVDILQSNNLFVVDIEQNVHNSMTL